jgi:GNAT superfamily N-acetyltransferase
MSPFDVRRIDPEDAAAIAALWIACTAEVAANEPIYTPAISWERLTERLRSAFVDGRSYGWVAEAGGRLAGYVTCRIGEETPVFRPRRFIYVADLDVAPQWRRRSVSRLLMAAVERDARAQGITRLELGVVYRDSRSRAVWERHGFQPFFLQMHKDLQ